MRFPGRARLDGMTGFLIAIVALLALNLLVLSLLYLRYRREHDDR